MTCVKCRAKMSPVQAIEMSGHFRGRAVKVRVQGRRCEACGYQMVEGRHMASFMLAVADAYRASRGLLTAGDIRRGRERLGMSQSEFSDYLGVGIASLKRWESGDVQTKSVDELIRFKTDADYAEAVVAKLYERLAANAPPAVGTRGDLERNQAAANVLAALAA
jgi:putative zinc finger/helix-turn-helix YgiT family protein